MNDFLKKLKSVAGAIGSLSIILPAYSFFSKNTPPLFDAIGIITAALSFAFLYLGFRSTVTKETKLKRYAKQYLLAALVFVTSYLIMLVFTTVKISNSKQSVRYQVGFWTNQWSLTPNGVAYLKQCEHETPEEFLLCIGATENNVYFLWDRTYIILFGVINLVLFCLASFCWAYGWGLFVKLVPTDT